MAQQTTTTTPKTQPANPVAPQKDAAEKMTSIWDRYNKPLSYVLLAIIVVVGGIFAYKQFVSGPKEQKASEALFRAESYYRMDSIKLALNGDGMSTGFVKIAEKFSGTKAGNLANFYAGSCFLKEGDFAKAIKYLKAFSTDAPQIQARANALLGDAYAETGKKTEPIDMYKKAGTVMEKDEVNSPEYLFLKFAGKTAVPAA